MPRGGENACLLSAALPAHSGRRLGAVSLGPGSAARSPTMSVRRWASPSCTASWPRPRPVPSRPRLSAWAARRTGTCLVDDELTSVLRESCVPLNRSRSSMLPCRLATWWFPNTFSTCCCSAAWKAALARARGHARILEPPQRLAFPSRRPPTDLEGPADLSVRPVQGGLDGPVPDRPAGTALRRAQGLLGCARPGRRGAAEREEAAGRDAPEQHGSVESGHPGHAQPDRARRSRVQGRRFAECALACTITARAATRQRPWSVSWCAAAASRSR